MNLISKGKAVDLIKHEADTHCLPEYKEAYIRAASIIACMPNEEAEPVKHGHWINTNNPFHLRCSECEIVHMIAQYPNVGINWCPNCGARMKSNEQEEEHEHRKETDTP